MPNSSSECQSGFTNQPPNYLLISPSQDICSSKLINPVTWRVVTAPVNEETGIWTLNSFAGLSTKLHSLGLGVSHSICLENPSFTPEYLTLLITPAKGIEGILFSSHPMGPCLTSTSMTSSEVPLTNLSGAGGRKRNSRKRQKKNSGNGENSRLESLKRLYQRKLWRNGEHGRTSK